MAYSTNKLTVAIYPICLEYLDEQGTLKRGGAIVFVSDDKRHDYQQVCKFEKRMFEIARTHCPNPIKIGLDSVALVLFSLGPEKLMGKLISAPDDFNVLNVSFEYFEANEGKNVSDSIGSIVKCAFQRGITKQNEGVSTCSEIVNIIKSEVKASTSKFDFFVVEEFDAFERADNQQEYPLPGILNVHSLKLHPCRILANKLSCMQCTTSSFCENACKVNHLLALHLLLMIMMKKWCSKMGQYKTRMMMDHQTWKYLTIVIWMTTSYLSQGILCRPNMGTYGTQQN